MRIAETKGRRQVAKGAPAPVADIGLTDASESLQKLKHGGVVESLARYPASRGPGRHENARNPESGADRKAFGELVRRAGRSNRRRNVVKEPVVLVVVEDEHSFRPHVRIGRDGIDLAATNAAPSAGMKAGCSD
jgi:hypothetical protein